MFLTNLYKHIDLTDRRQQIIAGVVALFVLIILVRFILRPKIAADNAAKIRELHPRLRAAARRFLGAAKRAGIDLRITEAYRSHARQAELYAQGRTAPGTIVTNARAGRSFHQYGLAFDVVDRTNGYNADWPTIGRIGQRAGFEWGGSWTSFQDRPHFQNKLGYTIDQLQNLYNAGKWTINS